MLLQRLAAKRPETDARYIPMKRCLFLLAVALTAPSASRAGDWGNFAIVPVSAPKMVLEAVNAGKADGTVVSINKRVGKEHQKWSIVTKESGWFKGERLVRGSAGDLPHRAGNLGLVFCHAAAYSIRAFGADARNDSGAVSLLAPPAGSTGLGSVFGPPFGDHRLTSCVGGRAGSRLDG